MELEVGLIGLNELEKFMLITVVTVCFNAEKTIERTFESIISQNDKNFEYLVIDGKSEDRTVDIIKKWENRFKESGIKFNWISEKDSGLYDAMNKAISIASGDWIIYLNADDEFNEKDVITFAKEHLHNSIDILYGDSIFVDKNGIATIRNALPIETIKKHLPFIPQSAFIKKSVQRDFAFDLQYKIAADYDSFLRMYLSNKVFRKIDYCFSKFYEGGISNQNEWETYKEDINIKNCNGILKKKTLLQALKYIRRWIFYRI